MKLKEVTESLIGETLILNGWVLTARFQSQITFIKMTDGSNDGIQIVCDFSPSVTIGTSIQAKGILVKSPSSEQKYELSCNSIEIIGTSEDYPLAKSKMSLEYLRKFPHLRNRTSSYSSIFRIKSAISFATHLFYHSRGFIHLNPNIITVNECEGGAGVFQITEKDITFPNKLIMDQNKYDWKTDHFGKPVYLTVSSQLQLEALACSLGAVYTTNKSFRSEHSSTNKHLSEFEHLEIENTFITLNELMQIGEDYIKYIASYLLENNMSDIQILSKFVSKGLLERIQTISSTSFNRITYNEAIPLLEGKIKHGEDLSSECEHFLTEYFKGPVFVYNWPSSIKSFYMYQNGDGTCSNFDLLMPYKVGELIGGSMREERYDVLVDMMKKKGVEPSSLQFYLDLRKYGSVPHGGFGLGLDRMCMLFTGMENIKDVVTFPIYYGQCEF